ncbi:prolyl oligopeptidase family serine peptidase [Motilimonas pumila]|nr:prolyl oligopeptidase family serine peptidase [Motilimonas pumila]
MRHPLIAITLAFITASAWADNLLSERAGFTTVLTEQQKITEAMPHPPAEIFKVVQYDSEIGPMSAYLSQHQLAENEKRPAIIWLTGGFPTSSPGEYLWTEIDVDNEQSARVYRNYGIVMMHPTLRGGTKGNPGVVEQFYGEVNDVISAAKYLKSLDYIDPNRIYLGGHSTGGTLALLVAQATDMFAGVIALGPSSDHYGKKRANFEWQDKEIYLRSPRNFMSYINTPTYIVEGEQGRAANIKDFEQQLAAKPNDKVTTALIKGADHFNLIHSINTLFANAIVSSKSGALSIDVNKQLIPAYLTYVKKVQETTDLRILANLRSQGVVLDGKQAVESYYYARSQKPLNVIAQQAKAQGMSASAITEKTAKDGSVFYMASMSKSIDISSLAEVFAASKAFKTLADEQELYYDYWTLASQ